MAVAQLRAAVVGPRVRFRHPLVRSAAYRSASADERHAVHRALRAASMAEISELKFVLAAWSTGGHTTDTCWYERRHATSRVSV